MLNKIKETIKASDDEIAYNILNLAKYSCILQSYQRSGEGDSSWAWPCCTEVRRHGIALYSRLQTSMLPGGGRYPLLFVRARVKHYQLGALDGQIRAARNDALQGSVKRRATPSVTGVTGHVADGDVV